MPFEPISQEEERQLALQRTPHGPSSKVICRVNNGNVCGSGSHVGVRDGKSLILTNAHVAGTKLGKQMTCTFPDLNNRNVPVRVIMAAYSDQIMMDWAVLEADEELNLPHVKLSNQQPQGEHYTGGYPRCQGPYYDRLVTRGFTNGGTVWRWQPDAIGGQSGSGVHAFSDHLQYGLLTWSWGGDGAGQTTRSIWAQYVTRTAFGEHRPPGLVELNHNRAEDLEPGFFSQANITTLPIWAHLDTKPPVDPPQGNCGSFAQAVRAEAMKVQEQALLLLEMANQHIEHGEDDNDGNGSTDDGGTIFGL